jgi:hypothetical protein
MASAREKALKEFQRYRRYVCADGNGYAPCVSCGKYGHVSKMDGGHYESRKTRATELEPDNVWPQCKYCNGPLSGNHIAYRNHLISNIGLDRVQRIENMVMAAKGSEIAIEKLNDFDRYLVNHKRKDKEYLEIARKYKKLADELEKEKCIKNG